SPIAGSVVGREGIEPPQSKTADLQSAELTTCSTYPLEGDGSRLRPRGEPRRPDICTWSRRWDSNPEPAVYKTAALPIELRRRAGPYRRRTLRRRGMIRSAPPVGQARSASSDPGAGEGSAPGGEASPAAARGPPGRSAPGS